MAIFKCKICGGDLNIQEGATICVCEYCETKQTIPALDNEKKLNLFNRANRLRLNSEFDKAASIYESIIAEFPGEAEGYWGLVLCNYGIEYVDDPTTARKIPTCHRAAFESVTKDENYKLAIEYADVVAQKVYRDEAREIDRIMSEILNISKNEEPYDIFICYKETDETGNRTIDSVIAQDVYDALTDKGYRVFFSRISLEDKIGTQYEPYIFAALNSAKVMLAFGTKYEYFHAVWVKNEWSRFLKLMAKDKSKALVPCYKDIDPYDMPDEFKALQAQDMGKVGAIQDLVRGIEKLLSKKETVSVKEPAGVNLNNTQIEPLLKRAFMFLEDGDFARADEFCEQVLNIDPENAQAYLGKLMVDLRINKYNDLGKIEKNFDNNTNYIKAYRFADNELKSELDEYRKHIKLNIAEALYRKASLLYETSEDTCTLLTIAGDLNQISGYKNVDELAEQCRAKAENISRLKEFERIENEKELIRVKEKRNKRNKKMAGIVISVVAVVIVFAIVLNTVIIPKAKFKDIVAISSGDEHTIALKSDGTVVATGSNDEGQCNISDWTDIIAVSAGVDHSVGLKSDGTVVATGSNDEGECDISDWTNIIAISAGNYRTVGLKSDGTVVTTDESYKEEVAEWTDIVAVSTHAFHTVGLKSNGTVIAIGGGAAGECDVEEWTDIVAVSAGSEYTVGLKSDGTVVTTDNRDNVSDWTDIIAISAGGGHTVGLKSDGTVVATSNNNYGQCNVNDWTDITAIYAGGWCTIGLKYDGTVVAVGDNSSGQCLVGG